MGEAGGPGDHRPVALITGASSGIGESLAHQFARGGYDLVLVARREARLHDLSTALARSNGARAAVIVADLADPATPSTIVSRTQDLGIELDALVNNAGYGVQGAFAATPERAELDMVRVNVTALVHLTKLFLPAMIRRRRGKILNVASAAAYFPGPFMAGYYASKAFVLAFSQSLSEEVRGTGVSVTALCPGSTATEFSHIARNRESGLRRLSMSAESVARAGYNGLMAGKSVVIPGIGYRLAIFGTRFLPSRLIAAGVGWLNRAKV